MPSVPDLTGQTVSYEKLKAFGSVSSWLEVQTGSDRLVCKDSNACKVVYSWGYTPIWYYLSPPIMYHGMNVSLYMDPKNAPNYKRSDQLAADIRLAGIRFLTTAYDENFNMSKNKI